MATPREERLANKRAYMKARREARTPEEHAAFLAAKRARRSTLTPEQRAAERARWRDYWASLPPTSKKKQRRQYFLKYRYGITVADFEALLAAQNGLCAVCGADKSGTRKGWHVDHDHATGKVRGILCHKCNSVLGALGDTITSVQASCARYAAYLERTDGGGQMSKLLDQFGNPASDSYCTPYWLTARLPLVDLDPCSNPRSTVRARRAYSLEKKLDGLKLPWVGSVFLNWPYSDPLPWAEKLKRELLEGRCTEAIVLCKLDSSTEWWSTLTGISAQGLVDLWTFDRRIQFDEPPELIAERVRKFAEAGKSGGEKSSNNFCSAIVHHRRQMTSPLDCIASVASRWSKS